MTMKEVTQHDRAMEDVLADFGLTMAEFEELAAPSDPGAAR